MATTAERLNNAIVRLSIVARPTGARKAVEDLAKHWQGYWNSTRRAAGVPVFELGKLRNYAAWYTRAWNLLSPELRARAPNPRQIDPSLTSAVDDTIRGLKETVQAGERSATFLERRADALEQEVRAAGEGTKSSIATAGVWIGLSILAGFFLLSRRRPA